MSHHYTTVLDREIHYVEYSQVSDGEVPKQTIVMVHGLARTCADFSFAASFLSKQLSARVICPDIIGRGTSAWSVVPEKEYNPVFYAVLLASLLENLKVETCVLFGTSMGGLIALLGVGAQTPLAKYVSKIVLNDVGPFVPPAAVQRIMTYMMAPPVTRRVSELIDATHDALRLFGYDLSAQERFSLLEPCIRRLPDGNVTLHFDPAILKGFQPPPPGTPDLWFFYDQVKVPILIVRGEDSDVLLPETATEMLSRAGKSETATMLTIARCGHAPAFMTTEHCELLLPFISCS